MSMTTHSRGLELDYEVVWRLRQLGLTERQAEIYLYLFEVTRTTGIQPSVRDLGVRFEIRSPNGILCHLRYLRNKGWLALASKQGRSVRLLRRPDGGEFTGFVLPDSEDRGVKHEDIH